MLFAAALTSKNQTYNDGTQLEIKNPPKIDINADYFKTLPQNMQDVLKKYEKYILIYCYFYNSFLRGFI